MRGHQIKKINKNGVAKEEEKTEKKRCRFSSNSQNKRLRASNDGMYPSLVNS